MNLEQIQTLEETGEEFLEIHFFDLGICDWIRELFLVKYELFVITNQKKMFKICVQECPKELDIEKVLNFELNEGFYYGKCIESKIDQSVYILFFNKNTSISIIYKCNLTTMEIIKKTKINKKFTAFKVDPEDPSILYCYSILEKNVYKVYLNNDPKQEDSMPDTETMSKLGKKENQILLEKKQREFIEKEVSNLELFFSDPVNSILNFSFDKNKKFFLDYYNIEIKKYDWETKKLLHIFKGHVSYIRELIFAEDFSLMIR